MLECKTNPAIQACTEWRASIKGVRHICSEVFPSGSVVKNPPANAGDSTGTALISGSGRFPGEGNGNPLQYSLPGKSHRQRRLTGYSPWGCKRVRQDLGTKQQQMCVPICVYVNFICLWALCSILLVYSFTYQFHMVFIVIVLDNVLIP